MHERYQTPMATRIWDPQEVLNRWTRVSCQYAKQRAQHQGLADLDRFLKVSAPGIERVKESEKYTGHEVVGFLRELTKHLPDDMKPMFHYGLTSSDIVDNAHFQALTHHTSHLRVKVSDLMRASYEPMPPRGQTLVPGHTHGQVAELTSWEYRLNVWREVLREILAEFEDMVHTVNISKSPGPTGQTVLTPPIQDSSANVLSTQVIPRDYQLRWASLYLRLCTHIENLAMQIRLGSRSEVAEVSEGQSLDRAGSSAMPHKQNPIQSEQLCGLARVARGHFLAIAEGTVLWEDRDLSNSSTERIAVPDLAALAEYMVASATRILRDLVFDTEWMGSKIGEAAFTNLMQSLFQHHAQLGPYEANRICRDIMSAYPCGRWLEGLTYWMDTERGPDRAAPFVAEYNRQKAKMLATFG